MFKKLFTTEKEKKRELIDTHDLQLFLGFCGIFLPLLCFLIGKAFENLSLQISISAYYHTVSQDIFVGILCIFAACFISYKGYNRGEQYLGNIMGLLALCIAFFPSKDINFHSKPIGMFQLQPEVSSVIHYIAAISLFFFLGMFSFCFFTKSDKPKKKRDLSKKIQNVFYKIFGCAIWGSGIFAIFSFLPFSKEWFKSNNILFWIETIMLVSFGASWLIKSKLGFFRKYLKRRTRYTAV